MSVVSGCLQVGREWQGGRRAGEVVGVEEEEWGRMGVDGEAYGKGERVRQPAKEIECMENMGKDTKGEGKTWRWR